MTTFDVSWKFWQLQLCFANITLSPVLMKLECLSTKGYSIRPYAGFLFCVSIMGQVCMFCGDGWCDEQGSLLSLDQGRCCCALGVNISFIFCACTTHEVLTCSAHVCSSFGLMESAALSLPDCNGRNETEKLLF